MLMPSSVTVVQVGRPPLMPVCARLVMAFTPGCILIRLVTSGLGSGMSSTCFWRTVELTSGDVVDTSDAPAVTSTDSATAPSSRRAVREYSWPTTIVTFENAAVLKPCSAVSTLYEPTGVLEQMREEGVVTDYALGGATAVLFYAEPTRTYDIGVFALLPSIDRSVLVSLAPVYRWA